MKRDAIESPFCKRTNPNMQNYRIDMALQEFHTMEELLRLLPDCSEKRIRSHIKWLVDNCSGTCTKEEKDGKVRFVLNHQRKAEIQNATIKTDTIIKTTTIMPDFKLDKAMNDSVDKEYVEKYLKSWEKRHDDWVLSSLSKTISSRKTTLSDIKEDLRDFVYNDWRGGVAFFADRTSYQGGIRSDKTNTKIAEYLSRKIVALPECASENELAKLLDVIKEDKETNKFSSLWQHDLYRLQSIFSFIAGAHEKNITKIMLERIKKGDCETFIRQSFKQIGPKTSSFYLKFIVWMFDLDELPITIDQHVFKSLRKYGFLSKENYEEAKAIIIQIGRDLRVSPVHVETALYEESWLLSNRNN